MAFLLMQECDFLHKKLTKPSFLFLMLTLSTPKLEVLIRLLHFHFPTCHSFPDPSRTQIQTHCSMQMSGLYHNLNHLFFILLNLSQL